MVEITKKDVERYEECRMSGRTNMFDVRNVMALTGLNRETIREIMEHYTDYMEKFKVKRG